MYIVIFIIAIAIANWGAMAVGGRLSAMHRHLMGACTSIIIWLVSIFIYYVVTSGEFGEALDLYSLIQLAGFTLLVIGALTYGANRPAEGSIVVDVQQIQNELVLDTLDSDALELTPMPIATSV